MKRKVEKEGKGVDAGWYERLDDLVKRGDYEGMRKLFLEDEIRSYSRETTRECIKDRHAVQKRMAELMASPVVVGVTRVRSVGVERSTVGVLVGPRTDEEYGRLAVKDVELEPVGPLESVAGGKTGD